MKRRGFLGLLAGLVAGLFGRKAVVAGPEQGQNRKQSLFGYYRLERDGSWIQIRPGEEQPGDCVISFCARNGRLNTCQAYTVAKGGAKTLPDGLIVTDVVPHSRVDFLAWAREDAR